MIPVKIHCGCGQKYAFDVEPSGGRMSETVQCPACGADGTTAANESIALHLAANSNPASALFIRATPREAPIRPTATVAQGRARNVSGRGIRNKWRSKWLALGLSVSLITIALLAKVVIPGRVPRETGKPVVAPGREERFPQTLAELQAWYVEPPKGENAAAVYDRGFKALEIGSARSSNLPLLGKGQLPPCGAPMAQPMKSALEAFLKPNQKALQILAQGAKYDHCRYPVDLTLGYDAVFAHLPKLNQADVLLQMSAIFHAEANQGEQAANDLLTSLRLAHSLTDEPSTLSQLLRADCVARVLTVLERTVNRTRLPAAACVELAKAFQEMEVSEAHGDGFTRALVGEHAMSLAALADSRQLSRALSAPDLKMRSDRRNEITARLRTGVPLAAEREFYEAAFRRLVAAREETFPGRLRADELGRQLLEEAASKELVVLDLLLPSLSQRTTAEAECLACLRLGLTAVALERFRTAHAEQYPALLSELAPDYLSAAPADPFDSHCLRYQQRGAGYVLYSIGPDRQDNSGQPKNGKTGDIVLTVVTPASAGK